MHRLDQKEKKLQKEIAKSQQPKDCPENQSLRHLLLRASKLQSKLKSKHNELIDKQQIAEKEQLYESSKHKVKFENNQDLESLGKLTMFDSRIQIDNTIGEQPEDESSKVKSVQASILLNQIEALEQQLIARTSKVLKNAEIVKEFQKYKEQKSYTKVKNLTV